MSISSPKLLTGRLINNESLFVNKEQINENFQQTSEKDFDASGGQFEEEQNESLNKYDFVVERTNNDLKNFAESL
jgi:hypothetical protein